MSQFSYSALSSRRDTPTEIDAQTQTTEQIRSVIYDESYLTDEEPAEDEGHESADSEDESNKPAYLQRTKVKVSTNEKQRQLTQMLLRGGTTLIKQELVEKWRPRKIDYNRWRKVNLDNEYGTFYAHKPETVAFPDELPILVSTSREPAEGHLFGGVDSYHLREKSYINRIRQTLPQSPFPGRTERKRFSTHIIQEYKRPLKDIKPNGYGTPRSVALSQTYEDTTDVVDSLIKPNIGYNVMPKRQNPEKCDRLNKIACEFCDVLGPGSCGMCIEATNRRISHDVEEAAFPAVDCSATSLVAPSLSQTMTAGDRLMKNITLTALTDPIKPKTTFALPPIKRPVPSVAAPAKKLGKMGMKIHKTERAKASKKVSLPPISRSHKIEMPPFERRNSLKNQRSQLRAI